MKNKIINWKLLRLLDNLYLYYELDINIDCLKHLTNWLYESHPFISNKQYQYLKYCCIRDSIPRGFITNPFTVYKSNLTNKYYVLSKYNENKYPTLYNLQFYLERGAVLYNSIIDIEPDTIIYREGQTSIDNIKLEIDKEVFYRTIDLFLYIWKYY